MEYLKALRINPNYPNTHNQLGLALAGKGNLDAAIREYLVALRINPDDADTHYNLGIAFQTEGNLDAAIREYREALQITPNDKGVNDILERALAPHLMHPSEIH